MPSQFPDLDVAVRAITAEELKARLDEGERVTLLDTRRPTDFEAWHIEHPSLEAVNVPFTAFLDGEQPAEAVPAGVPEGHVVTCCAKGISSQYVAEFLAREGRSVEALADGMRGWARLYEAVDVQTDPLVRQYYRPSSGCLGYLVCDGGEAAVVDPLRAFTERYEEDVSDLDATLRYAADTHVHADHVSGIRALNERTDCTVVLPAGATDRGLAFDATHLSQGDTLTVGETTLEAVDLSGHTTEMTGILVDETVLLAGDSVFLDGVARPDLEDPERAREAADRLYDTVQELANWPGDVRLAPGHTAGETERAPDSTFTRPLGAVCEALPAMDREGFVEWAVADLPPRPTGYEMIIDANLGRDDLGDEELLELELGPNNCAAV